MTLGADRIARNNRTFRDANEKIRSRAEELGDPVEHVPFLCECPDPECTEIVQLTLAEYARIRADGTHYFTAPGHEQRELPVGKVVSREDGYVIVTKSGGEREPRIGLNEAIFREVNERIEGIAESFGLTDEPLDLVCECGKPACVERITMTRAEYEELRSEPQQFAVHPGHETLAVESVVAKRKGYDVVRKREGVPAEIAKRTAPRRDD